MAASDQETTVDQCFENSLYVILTFLKRVCGDRRRGGSILGIEGEKKNNEKGNIHRKNRDNVCVLVSFKGRTIKCSFRYGSRLNGGYG